MRLGRKGVARMRAPLRLARLPLVARVGVVSVRGRSVRAVRHIEHGAVASLWVDPLVHASECARFQSYIVAGPTAGDCDIWRGAIGGDGYGR